MVFRHFYRLTLLQISICRKQVNSNGRYHSMVSNANLSVFQSNFELNSIELPISVTRKVICTFLNIRSAENLYISDYQFIKRLTTHFSWKNTIFHHLKIFILNGYQNSLFVFICLHFLAVLTLYLKTIVYSTDRLKFNL